MSIESLISKECEYISACTCGYSDILNCGSWLGDNGHIQDKRSEVFIELDRVPFTNCFIIHCIDINSWVTGGVSR